MDARSALAGTTQISVHCSQCNCTITKWVSQVKSVDNNITSLKDNLLALQLSYDKLDASLKDTTMLNVARTTDNYAGGNLWSQLSTALKDCQNTILTLRQVLQNIEYVSRRTSSIMKHLAEALTVGEMVVMSDAIHLLEQNIAFPIAMINITLALQQPQPRETTYKGALRDLTTLKSDHDGFLLHLRKYLGSSQSTEQKIFQHMQSFASTVNIFMNNTANSLSQASAASLQPTTNHFHPEDGIQLAEVEGSLHEDAATTYAAEAHERPAEPTASTRGSSTEHNQNFDSNIYDVDSENDNEIELELTMEYMANGRADLEIEDFSGAEENFRRALEMAEENEFSTRFDYSPGDITLMLADCLMRQEKEEEALELLEPVADGTAAFIRNTEASSEAGYTKDGREQGLGFKASHILAVVFLKRLDFEAAEKRAKEAFKGRRRLLGAQHSMTLESVQLIIDIYTAKDDKINARAYRRFLEPPPRSRYSAGSGSSQVAPASHPALVNHTPNTHGSYVPVSVTAPLFAQDPQTETSLPTRSTTIRTAPSTAAVPLQNGKATCSPLEPSAASPTPQLPSASSQSLSHLRQHQVPSSSHTTYAQSSLVSTQGSSASLPRAFLQHDAKLTQIAEHESVQPASSSVEPNLPIPPLLSPPPKIEPDALSPNIGSTMSRKRMSWSNPFSRSSANRADSNVLKKPDKDSSGTVTEDASRNSSVTGISMSEQKRPMNLASGYSFDTRGFYNKSSDYSNEKEPCPSIDSRSYSVSTHPPARTRQELVPRFSAIKTLRQEGKKSSAIDSAMKLLKEYDPDRKVLIIREAELKKNMKESHKGMAGTGYGYAPIHFFCERKVEANIEVELLIEQGVDVNAVACKAGLPGTDPFTPLQRAVELGHVEIVRLLVEADVSIAPPRPQRGAFNSGTKDQLNQPLLIACTKGHTEITFVLLTAGAAKLLKEFPRRQWHGNSLLHEACWQADTEMVKMLLDYSRNLKEQHRQSTSGQPDYQSGMIGSPGQQDQFGATPIMYAIDLRDCTSDRMRALKTAKRKDCLRLLLEHDVHGGLHSQSYRESIARMLSLKWTKRPGAGHSIFCYADEAGDDELTRLLDPFRYQVSPGMRCSATPQCSATLRSSILNGGNSHSGDGVGRRVRLPSFPELMSTPVELSRDSESMHEGPPPSFEAVVGSMSPVSPIFDHERTVSMSLTSATGTGVGMDMGTSFT